STIEISTEFATHTYSVIKENEDKIEIDLCNLRLDTDAVCSGLESEDQFMREYAAGGKMDNPNDFRTSVITLTGFDSAPSVNATASNGAMGRAEWDSETKTMTLTIISNGETRITIER
ncbi:MAG: hypothetical protein J6R20_07320, partial [Clostridia bacterium]|nr:hypothetical protein [Clostridia bacterium]